MTTFDYGPIEFYAIAFDGDRPGPAVLQAIDDLVDSGTVNLLDLVFARRSPEGEIEVFELSDTIDDGAPALDLAGLAGQDDILFLAESLEPGSSAAILVIELLGPRLSRRRCTMPAAPSSRARAFRHPS